LSESFKFQLVLDAVARAENTPNGLMVRYITGQWGNDSIDETDDKHHG
jgi:hypothetical protein